MFISWGLRSFTLLSLLLYLDRRASSTENMTSPTYTYVVACDIRKCVALSAGSGYFPL